MHTVSIDTRFLGELKDSADASLERSVKALEAIQSGECQGSEWLGWYDYPRRHGFDVVRTISSYKESIDFHYDLVVVIGIGGSYAGTKAVDDAIAHKYQGWIDKASAQIPIVYAGHNLSESELVELIDLMDAKQPLVNVISKSGTTTEPSVAFRVIRRYLEQRFGVEQSARRIVATTDKDRGVLRSLAEEQGYKTFPIPADIGGRFSVLSCVGLIPLALAGYDIKLLLEGADAVFESIRSADNLSQEPVVQYAAARIAAFESGKAVEVLAIPEPRLIGVLEWWKQLFGESEGKDGKGLVPTGLVFTTDLHSLGQMVQDGVRNLFETVITCKNATKTGGASVERSIKVPHLSGNCDQLNYLEGRSISEINMAAIKASQLAHFDGGVPGVELNIATVDLHTLGALFAFFEVSCAIGGVLLKVNPFDQPGVEEYKKNLFGLMGKPGYEELGGSIRSRL